jgi:hypothetical protein
MPYCNCDACALMALQEELDSVTAQLVAYEKFVRAIVANTTNGVCPVCSYLWSECECGVEIDPRRRVGIDGGV